MSRGKIRQGREWLYRFRKTQREVFYYPWMGKKMSLKIGDTIATGKFLSYLRQCGIMGLSDAAVPQLVDK